MTTSIRHPELVSFQSGVVALSGGLDSCVLLALAKQQMSELLAVTFDYSQRHRREIESAQRIAHALGVPHVILSMPALAGLAGSSLTDSSIDTPSVDETYGDPQPVTYVPNRNMIFLATLAAVAEGCGLDSILYGITKHDAYSYWDTTHSFFAAMNSLLGQNRKTPLKIVTPFSTYTKKEIIQLGFDLDAPLGLSWSCYEGGENSCGRCTPCRERAKAFKDLGREDWQVIQASEKGAESKCAE